MKFSLKCRWIIFLVISFVPEEISTDGITYKTSFSSCKNIPDLYKKTSDFIEANGFLAETHSVTTEDGYIVSVHRIVRRKSKFARVGFKPAVLIQHGIAGRSDNWLLNGEKSFPFLLSNAGYDVWLADSRGNNYSKGHVTLSPTDPRFWNFSFHEQGYFDLAAMTNYVLKISGQKKIFYVGHSRGTTMIYVLLSQRPEFNKKFRLVICFSPVAYFKGIKSPILRTIIKSGTPDDMKTIARHLGGIAIPGITSKTIQLRKKLCSRKSPTFPLCSNMLFLLSGFDYEQFNASKMPVILSHFPAGGSVKEYLHYLQNAQSDKFRPFDYGEEKNMEVYGQNEPPEYNLENIVAPISLCYSMNDYVVSIPDLERLDSKLKSVVARYKVPHEKFNHIDFLWATDADKLIYIPTLKLMNSFVGFNLFL